MDAGLIIIISVAVLVMIIALTGVKQVPQSQAVIIERLGKYHKTLDAGLNFILPFFDKKRFVKLINYRPEGISDFNIDLREQVFDIPEQSVITKDNITLSVDTLVFYQIIEAYKACYEISNLIMALKELSKTTMRNIFGEMDLDTSLSARDSINNKLRTILDEATDKWGVKVNRVELQDINPPQEIKMAMEKQMRAERDRRAKILTAEGEKRSQILIAEGEREANIARAEGEARAKFLVAEAEAKAIGEVASAVEKTGTDPAQYLLAVKYIKAFSQIVQNNDKTIVVPYEASAMLGSVKSLEKIFKS